MIYIETNPTTHGIGYTHYMPFDKELGLKNEDGTLKTEAQLKETGFLVESVPTVPHIEGKRGYVTYTEENGFSFEYIELPQNYYLGVSPADVQKIQDDMTLALIEAGVL